MKFTELLKSLVDLNSKHSSNIFSLVVSVLTGGLIAIIICFCLVWDVVTNNYVKSNLTELGIFLLCVGGYIAGSGINKAILDRGNVKIAINKEKEKEAEKTEEEVNG